MPITSTRVKPCGYKINIKAFSSFTCTSLHGSISSLKLITEREKEKGGACLYNMSVCECVCLCVREGLREVDRNRLETELELENFNTQG